MTAAGNIVLAIWLLIGLVTWWLVVKKQWALRRKSWQDFTGIIPCLILGPVAALIALNEGHI